jgi:glycosyltransferase involved in cell wall biosynthesis
MSLNILFLAKQFPWPLNVGSRQRIFHLIRGLSLEHNVDVIAYDAMASQAEQHALSDACGCASLTIVPRPIANGDSAEARRLLSRVSRGARMLWNIAAAPLPTFVRNVWSQDLVDSISQRASRGSVDLVYATQSWMAEHARAAGLRPICVDVDDLLSLMSRQRVARAPRSLRKPIDAAEASKDVAYERSLSSRFDRVIVAKTDDVAFFPAANRDRVSVVPNGISIPASPIPEPTVANSLLFIGTLGYEPNIDAVRWFATEMLPLIWNQRPDVRFEVAGFGTADAIRDVMRDPRCEVFESPPDLGPVYARSALVVAPVRIGGGTRIKILEGLARGRALVSTEFAAEGLDLRGGRDLQFANTPSEIARACVELLADPARRASLATTGRATVAERFDWAKIEATMPQLATSFAKRANSQ